ncbi:MAG: putative transport system permease protein, partial [Chloroflexota bacterium]|nr:putative transport system permease protein [Chloroflexota bacterium]
GVLPAGSRIEPIWNDAGRLVLPGTETSVTVRSMNLDGLALGMLTVVDGRTPRGAGEVAISATVGKIAAVRIGDRVDIKGLASPTVVGIVEDPFDLKARTILQDDSAAEAAQSQQGAIWLVGLPPGSDGTEFDSGSPVPATNAPVFQITSRTRATIASEAPSVAIVVLGGLALVEAALVASAAFSVSVRRRQRDLGLLAAAGAEPRHLAGTVMAEGVLLGAMGAIAGGIVGLAAALVASPWLDQLTDRRNPPVGIAPTLLLVACGIGILAALIAAIVPAWTAARSPVLTALSGRRPAQRPARRTLGLGIVLIGVAIALTGIGAILLRDSGTGNTLGLLLALAGAVLGTLGFGACSPWLLERLERPAGRLPLVGRIAVRDTARARSRNGPIVTALLASFAATVALAAFMASMDARNAASWKPWLRPDQIYFQGDGVATTGPEAAQELGAVAAAPIPGAGSESRSIWISPGGGAALNLQFQNVTIGDGELLKALGAEAATTELGAGGVVLLSRDPASVTEATIHVVDAQGVEIGRLVVPARLIATGIDTVDLPGAVISATTAARVGITPGALQRFLIRLGHPIGEADLSRAAAITTSRSPDAWADASLGPPRSGDGFRLAMMVASLLFALSVTGVAVALGEAESRGEQRTLLALGADPRVRRRIAAARAAVIALLAGALAVPAGLLPIWGLLLSRGAPLVVPLPEIVASLAILPILVVVATFVLIRPIPSWSAFRGAGS